MLMDDLADEDHTHHLTPQEYYYYKSNWWLRSNKTGSDTVPVQRRPDFKQALSTLRQKQELKEINNGHKVLVLLHGGVGKVLGGLLISMKVTKATGYTSIWNNSSRDDFLEFIYFVTDGSLTADGGLL